MVLLPLLGLRAWTVTFGAFEMLLEVTEVRRKGFVFVDAVEAPVCCSWMMGVVVVVNGFLGGSCAGMTLMAGIFSTELKCVPGPVSSPG